MTSPPLDGAFDLSILKQRVGTQHIDFRNEVLASLGMTIQATADPMNIQSSIMQRLQSGGSIDLDLIREFWESSAILEGAFHALAQSAQMVMIQFILYLANPSTPQSAPTSLSTSAHGRATPKKDGYI